MLAPGVLLASATGFAVARSFVTIALPVTVPVFLGATGATEATHTGTAARSHALCVVAGACDAMFLAIGLLLFGKLNEGDAVKPGRKCPLLRTVALVTLALAGAGLIGAGDAVPSYFTRRRSRGHAVGRPPDGGNTINLARATASLRPPAGRPRHCRVRTWRPRRLAWLLTRKEQWQRSSQRCEWACGRGHRAADRHLLGRLRLGQRAHWQWLELGAPPHHHADPVVRVCSAAGAAQGHRFEKRSMR